MTGGERPVRDCPFWIRSVSGNRCGTMSECPPGYRCDVRGTRRRSKQTTLF
jgi:hypothetical protein